MIIIVLLSKIVIRNEKESFQKSRERGIDIFIIKHFWSRQSKDSKQKKDSGHCTNICHPGIIGLKVKEKAFSK